MNIFNKKEYNRIYRENNREKLRLYARNFRKEKRATRDKKRQEQTIALWKKKHPERRSAHGKVAYALKRGYIKKQPCEICKQVKVHAHHEDYSKPLEIIWLCPIHHWEWDNQRRIRTKEKQPD